MIKLTNTSFTGKVIHSFKTLDSTNNFSKILINQKTAENGCLVHTEFQSNGRGQKGNTWVGNEAENIYVSFIYHFDSLEASNFFALNRLTCLAIIKTLNSFSDKSFKIKWPNDIYYKDQKIAGILIENTVAEKWIKSTIIGIGINVNQVEYPDGINASSLHLIESKSFDIYNIIDRLATEIERHYLIVKEKSSALELDYHRLLYKLDEAQSFELNGNLQKATIQGVDKFGRLKLEIANEVRGYDHHEVKWKF